MKEKRSVTEFLTDADVLERSCLEQQIRKLDHHQRRERFVVEGKSSLMPPSWFCWCRFQEPTNSAGFVSSAVFFFRTFLNFAASGRVAEEPSPAALTGKSLKLELQGLQNMFLLSSSSHPSLLKGDNQQMLFLGFSYMFDQLVDKYDEKQEKSRTPFFFKFLS